jgi:hypothetical protein
MKKEDWISVEQRLPDWKAKRWGIAVFAVVLHYDTNGKSTRSAKVVAFKDGKFFHDYVGGMVIGEQIYQKVTHWMYLPELPKKFKPTAAQRASTNTKNSE